MTDAHSSCADDEDPEDLRRGAHEVQCALKRGSKRSRVVMETTTSAIRLLPSATFAIGLMPSAKNAIDDKCHPRKMPSTTNAICEKCHRRQMPSSKVWQRQTDSIYSCANDGTFRGWHKTDGTCRRWLKSDGRSRGFVNRCDALSVFKYFARLERLCQESKCKEHFDHNMKTVKVERVKRNYRLGIN